MGFFTSYKKYSYILSYKEMKIVDALLKLVEKDLPFKEPPSETFAKKYVDIKWSPMMFMEDDSTFGEWSFFDYSVIYVRPEENKYTAEQMLNSNCQYTQKQRGRLQDLQYRPSWADVFLKHDHSLDKRLASFLVYMLQNSGHMTTTILHELWHRHQFTEQPLKYFISSIRTNLTNYEYACTQPWSIEYDVREKVDNAPLKQKLAKIYTPVYAYLTALKKAWNPETPDTEKQKCLQEMADADETTKSLIQLCMV